MFVRTSLILLNSRSVLLCSHVINVKLSSTFQRRRSKGNRFVPYIQNTVRGTYFMAVNIQIVLLWAVKLYRLTCNQRYSEILPLSSDLTHNIFKALETEVSPKTDHLHEYKVSKPQGNSE
jgi:hypothetical protein